jgi:hypothetical protein
MHKIIKIVICTRCSLHVYTVYTACVHRVPCMCTPCTYRGLVLGEVKFLVEVDREDCLHPVVGEPLAELVPNDEKHTLRVGQRLKKEGVIKGTVAGDGLPFHPILVKK